MSTTTIIVIIFLALYSIVSTYAAINLLIKVEKYEDLLEEQLKYMVDISNLIKVTDAKLNELDLKGTFEADDEVGDFFKNLKKMQTLFNEYALSDNYAQKEK